MKLQGKKMKLGKKKKRPERELRPRDTTWHAFTYGWYQL